VKTPFYLAGTAALFLLSILSVTFLFCDFVNAQTEVTPQAHPFSTMTGGTYDHINLADLSIMFTLPVRNKLDFAFDISEVGNVVLGNPSTSCTVYGPGCEFTGGANGLLGGQLNAGFYKCRDGSPYRSLIRFVDSHGVTHYYNGSVGACGTGVTTTPTDQSGYYIYNNGAQSLNGSICDRDGNCATYNGTGTITSITDPSGNATAYVTQGTNLVYTEPSTPTGHAVLTSNTVPNGQPTSYWFASADQTTRYLTITHESLPWSYSMFNCGGNWTGTYSFPSAITYPDTSGFSFGYELIGGYYTGRVSSMALPTGDIVSYGYDISQPNDDMDCTTGTPWKLTRTTSDGTWTYVRSGALSGASTTTVTGPSPDGNVTVYNFYKGVGIGVKYYQGSINPSHLLKTDITCYNQSPNVTYATCVAATPPSFPIQQVDTFTTLGGMATASHVETRHDSFNNVTYVGRYDFGATTPTTQTIATYGSWSGSTCTGITHVVGRPCSVTMEDGSGNTLSQSYSTYDGVGDLLTVQSLISGSTYLSSTTTYNQNGTINVATDVNGAQTVYTQHTCNGMLPTLVNEPLGLSMSLGWNCDGGVATSKVDENGQSTTYGYNDANDWQGTTDPFWRMTSVTDPLGFTTELSYAPFVSNSTNAYSKRALTFNGGQSIQSTTNYMDVLGRPLQAQQAQAPGSAVFDTVSFTYDAYGRTSSVTVPCSIGANSNCATPQTTQTFDALNRPLVTRDGGGGTMTVTYSSNDSLTVIGPAPAGESVKQIAYEYDGLGRLASVCELTSAANGGVTCGQTNTHTGYWTRYKYDALGRLLGVCQDTTQPVSVDCVQNPSTGQQTRIYTYDGLSRLTAETNPESGTTGYTYDSDSTGGCPGTYNGDLVKRVDAARNIICYTYDALHRKLATTYSGPNSTGTNKYFVYDSATVDGQTMTNAKGRIAEAYTATCSTCSKVTDEGFGYSARGEPSAYYQSSPNSGGYYYVPITYWANGLIESFGPFLTEDEVGFIPDGAGRAGGVYDFKNHQNTVPSISYYTSTGQPTGNQPTQLETSCAGTTCYPISYTYDPSTLRMTQYSAALNGGTVSGSLTWNQNGNLSQLTIADPFNSADAQTCNFGADDLNRLASVNCGSTWAQTFAYDPFSNITKSGSISWNPGYSPSTNHFSVGSGATYDANGELTYDGTNNRYTWDAEGKALSVTNYQGSTTGFLYDAFGHQVESSNNGLYSTSNVRIGNFKLSAVGQNASYSEFPFPGGSMASEYGGLTGVQLGDWLGTSRAVWSYTGGSYIQSGAHAPFGEGYSNNTGYTRDFTGQQTVDGVTYLFPERLYHSTQGRWLSPDPAGMSAVDPAHPQTWNRYAYAMNDPLRLTDPLGLDSNDPCYEDAYTACVVAQPPDPVPTTTSEVDVNITDPGPITVPGETVTVTADFPEVKLIPAHYHTRWRPTACNGVTPRMFDYTTPQAYKGGIQSPRQHITQGHIYPGKGSSSWEEPNTMYYVSPWSDFPNTNSIFQRVQEYNAYTFTFGQASQEGGNGNISFVAFIPPTWNPYWNLPGFIGYYIDPLFVEAIPLQYNKFVLLNDCKTVRSSYSTFDP
jgi:RHS repeat-associated protein